MQKHKNIEFFGFSKMSFFRSAQPIWGPGKSTNKTKKIGSEAVFSEMTQTTSQTPERTGHRKKTGHKEPKQAKQRTKQVRTTMQRERRESKTIKATNKQTSKNDAK